MLLTDGAYSACAQDTGAVQCRMAERIGAVAILDCMPGYATDQDRVLIYSRIATDWGAPAEVIASLPNLAEGAVVFDAGADDTPNLVIVFSRRGDGALIADIYDDQNGDGKVSVTVTRDGELEVIERGPVVQVAAPDGWWQRDDRVNFNLDLTTDGPVRSTFGSIFRDNLITDGSPEAYIHVRDADHDGRPDYEWRQLYLPLDESSGYHRTEVVVNTQGDEPPVSGAVLWPYLGDTYSSFEQYAKLSYFQSAPAIDIDWATSRVTHVAEFVGSRTQPGNYFIYSLSRLIEGEVSVASFESPFAYYDLSGGTDAFPTLMIRDAYFSPRSPFVLSGAVKHPIHDISYVWRYPESRASNAPIWDFKVNLVGTHEHASVIEVGELAIVTGEYATFPYWVTEHEWDMATLVADEGGRVPNSEGIGAWGATLEHLAPQSYVYMAGLVDELSLDYFSTIPQGYRGEVAPRFGQQPRLYVSGLDGKLHLFQATAGIWNVDGETEVRYANLDGDAYIDQWQYFEYGHQRLQMNHMNDYLLFSGNGRVLLKKVSVAPSSVEMLPPRNHQEWSTMRENLDLHKLDLLPGDLEAMVAQHDGPEWRVSGAEMRDFRPEDNGFRFVLRLSPDYRFEGIAGPNVGGLSPGDYVVTYQDGFSVEPLTPAGVEIILDGLEPDFPRAVALEPMNIDLQLHNSGLTDLPELDLQVYAEPMGSAPQLVAEGQVSLLAGKSISRSFPWTPPSPGDWRISITWDQDEEASAAGKSGETLANLHVLPSPSIRTNDIWRLSNVGEPLPLLILMVALSFLASTLALIFVRSSVEEQ